MNIPIGTVKEEHVSFSEEEPFDKLKQLIESGFSGYMAATIEGVSGLEEGVLMINNREIVGAVFDALRLNKQLMMVLILYLLKVV